MYALRRQMADLSKCLKDITPRTHDSPRELVRQNEAMCVDTNAISKKPPLLIAQNTQHKLGVAFSHLERNKASVS